MSRYLTSNEFTGTKQLPINRNRDYLAIFATAGSLTIKINKGTGVVPVVEGGFYEPYVAPTSSVEIIGGTFTVVEG
tara:strand:- start:311 stop:538 length:228 start_codon:yes stop_codon:yes gene_type:complete